LGALARGGAAPHNPGGNLRNLSRPQAVHAGPAGPVLSSSRRAAGGTWKNPLADQGNGTGSATQLSAATNSSTAPLTVIPVAVATHAAYACSWGV